MTAGEALRGSPRPAGLFLSPSHLATLSSAGGPEPPGPSEAVSVPPARYPRRRSCAAEALCPAWVGLKQGWGGGGVSDPWPRRWGVYVLVASACFLSGPALAVGAGVMGAVGSGVTGAVV